MPTTAITWLGPDGTGGARLDEGGTLTVAGALPGDTVVWTEVGRRGRAVEGRIDAVLTPSPDRREAPCPHAAACGGCDLSELQPLAREAALSQHVARALGWTQTVPVVRSPREVAHRARIKLHVQGGRVGYLAPHSHTLVPITSCRIARPELQACLPDVMAWAHRHPDPQALEVELRTDGTRVVAVLSRELPEAAWADFPALDGVSLAGRGGRGDPTLHLDVQGLRLQAGPGSFFQVNLEANNLLVAHVVEQVRAAKPERVLDLYAGIGNLSLPIAALGVPVVAVEHVGGALRDLRASAETAGLRQVETVTADARRFDPSRTPFDVGVLDPPRAGADDVLARLLRNRPRRVVYVSCNVVGAARDLRSHGAGYKVTDVTAFDLFPDTHHVETVITLDR